MTRLRHVAVAAAALAIAGCGDNAYGTFAPTASGIFPSEAFLGRHARVEISGTGTSWDRNVSVDFGNGIGVGTVSVASPTTLFADVSIDDTTLPGLHDVTITDGDEVLTLKEAFLLQPPIALHFQGNVAQGAMALFGITNHDFDAPFDTTSFSESVFEDPIFTNITITTPPGVKFQVTEVTPYTITGTVLVDVDASIGGPIEVISGPANDALKSPLGSSITVTPRTALPLVGVNTLTTGTVTTAFDSHLYELTATGAPHVARFSVTTDEVDASPRVALLPASGHFADLITIGPRAARVATAPAGHYYLIYFDPRGGVGYQYTLAATTTALASLGELEPNSSSAAAQALALPLLFDHATLASQADEDWVQFDVGADAIGRRIRVITTGNDPKTDTRVDVLTPGLVSLGGPSNDANYHEDFTSGIVTTAGTYYARIAASQSVFFEPAHNAYVAAIFLE